MYIRIYVYHIGYQPQCLLTLIMGMLVHVSQINTQRFALNVYFTQLRHYQENTDLYGSIII